MSMEMNKAMELLRGLVSEIERQTCEHEETHRGGAIWEICDSCGAKWADDEGGKPEFEWPESVEKAREFLAAHPAVEQAGGDERAAFFKHLIGRHPANETEIVRVLEHNYSAWKAWQARAALAQPSPTIATAPTYQFHSREIGESDWAPCDFSWYLYCSKSPEMDTRVVEVTAQPSPKSGYYSDQEWINAGCPPEQPSPVQAEQAEAERPEVVARVVHSNPVVLDHCAPLNANDELMTVAQHAASVARWAEMFNRVEQERDAALARVAGLELGIARIAGDFLPDNSGQAELALDEMRQALHELLAAAPTQAQHSVPDGAADLCRFLAKLYCELDGLRYSTAKLPAEQIADALIFKWPVLQGARNQLNIKRISEQPYDESKLHSAIAAMLAAAPGKEGV